MSMEQNTISPFIETVDYSDEQIRTIEGLEHVRLRPGMYIGKLGDGSSQDDGIYVLLKEVIDNSIDEFVMGVGKKIEITLKDNSVRVRDWGRGIPLDSVYRASTKMNTGGKFDSKVFKKSVGLNGVGIKAVNALSEKFLIRSFRDGYVKECEFARGKDIADLPISVTDQPNGTEIIFTPDNTLFVNFSFRNDYIEKMLRNYTYLNTGLTILFNGVKFSSKNGIADLLTDNMGEDGLYPLIHLKGDDIEVAFTHGKGYGEDYYSFVNGQHTTQGGTHQQAFREAIVKTIKDFYKKEYEPSDIRQSIIGAISVRVEDPMFESQTKTKLGSKDMSPNGPTVRNYINNFIAKELDDYLHKNPESAKILQAKIQAAEKERKEIAGIRKEAKERAKKISLNNSKLRDCRIHFTDNHIKAAESSIFITEGLSASGSITKSRDPNTQAVFSLRGKPLNSYGLSKKVVYTNEEFNLLQAALNIEEGLENLRYNKVIIATDADDDGMHIRLLLLVFFLQFFPELIRNGHLYIFQTPLFRVRNKKKTYYCYSEKERAKAIDKLKPNPEITRFKGLGEIDPSEFEKFIGSEIRLDRVSLSKNDDIQDILSFYFSDKVIDARKQFIMDNLRIEEDRVEEIQALTNLRLD